MPIVVVTKIFPPQCLAPQRFLNRTLLFVAGTVCAALATGELAFKHGVSFFGEFKYPADFEHFDYVNPDAPKGGTMVLATNISWNSFTPYLHKGIVAPGVYHDLGSKPFFYDGLFMASDDEIGVFYGNLAEGVMIADDFKSVRMTLAFDYGWHNLVITRSFYTRPESYFAPSSFAAVGRPSPTEVSLLAPFRDELPPRVFTEPFELKRSHGVGRNRAMLLRARQLLKDAGWVVRDGALTNDAGEQPSLSVVIRNAEERRMVAQFVDQLRTLGFDMRVGLVDASHYVNIMKDFDFDISFGQLGVANPAGIEIVSYWHSSNAMLPLTRNLSGIQSEAVDELIMHVLNARSREC